MCNTQQQVSGWQSKEPFRARSLSDKYSELEVVWEFCCDREKKVISPIYKIISYFSGGGQRKKQFYESDKTFIKYWNEEVVAAEKYGWNSKAFKYVVDGWEEITQHIKQKDSK